MPQKESTTGNSGGHVIPEGSEKKSYYRRRGGRALSPLCLDMGRRGIAGDDVLQLLPLSVLPPVLRSLTWLWLGVVRLNPVLWLAVSLGVSCYTQHLLPSTDRFSKISSGRLHAAWETERKGRYACPRYPVVRWAGKSRISVSLQSPVGAVLRSHTAPTDITVIISKVSGDFEKVCNRHRRWEWGRPY